MRFSSAFCQSNAVSRAKKKKRLAHSEGRVQGAKILKKIDEILILGGSGPARGRTGTRLERPRNAKLGRLGRQVGCLGRLVGGSGRQVGNLERQVCLLGLLPDPCRAHCQREPFSEQRSKRVFALCWGPRNKPEA